MTGNTKMLIRMGMITYVGSAEVFSARVHFYVFNQAEFVMQGWIEINERNGITVFVCIVDLHSLYKKVFIGWNCLPLTNIVIDSLCLGSVRCWCCGSSLLYLYLGA